MPELVTYNTTNKIKYAYTASGAKLQKMVDSPTYGDKTVDYIGPFLYEDNDLKCIFTSEGRVVKVNDGGNVLWKYEYNLKDHLGNNGPCYSFFRQYRQYRQLSNSMSLPSEG